MNHQNPVDSIPIALTSPDSIGKEEMKVQSSPQDDRTYKLLTLPNKLTCLLISDPTTDKASAAMDVRVGHLSDFPATPGIAHFLEHMLFMGTEKYPDENDYNVYLSSHGGSSNAFTDMESTNYYFDINWEYIQGALDRFAQFFIAPLFHPHSTDKEMQAVDSEHAKNLQSDSWRSFQLFKSLCDPNHPFSKFGSGNLKTLKEVPLEQSLDIRELLLEFHRLYYSANVMKLVVLARESIDDLESIVTDLFQNIPNTNISVPTFPGQPFTPEYLCKRLHVVPVRDGMRSLDIHFPIREILSLYLTKPHRYLSHLIGHEGKGSIIELLKQKGWANELSAGDFRSCSDWSCFSISIDLTDEGLQNVNNVVSIVFSYLKLLKEKGPQRWVHDETSDVAACSFRFLSKMSPIKYTCSLAGRMQIYPGEHILSGPYLIYDYNPDEINELLEYFTPENMIVQITSKTFEGTTQSKELWYGTEYTLENISETLCKVWSNENVSSDLVQDYLSFPEKNDMIATNYSLQNISNFPLDEPRLLIDSDNCRLWYKPDNIFKMPKVNVMTLLRTSAVGSYSVVAAVLTTLWVEIINEKCNNFTYLASMAGLHSSVSNLSEGISLHVSGFNHKAHILLQRIINIMAQTPKDVDVKLFERVKDKIYKRLQNYLFYQPYQHAMYEGSLLLELNKWSINDKMIALQGVTLEDILSFSGEIISRFHLEMVVHGNISPDEAIKMSKIVTEGIGKLKPLASTLPQLRVVKLEDESEYVYRYPEPNEGNTNSCISVMFQIGNLSVKTHGELSFLAHLIKEPAFNELRTNEQLGYIVHTSTQNTGDIHKNLLFLVQSDAYDPIYIDQRIEAFIDRLRYKIVEMKDDEFQTNVDAVVNNLLEKNKNLGEESAKYWREVISSTYSFHKDKELAEHVRMISRRQILEFFDKYIAANGPKRKKISVQVFSKKHLDRSSESVREGVVLIKPEDVDDFKRSMPLFELPRKVDVKSFIVES